MSNAANNWWRGATIYQIYPRSFMDSNGDGVGDMAGIAQKLPYIASLGVDAIWISPFFKSPMKDFGYDVSDYCDVDPLFGDLASFDAVIAKAHGLGLKVMIDQVLSHCSDQHVWFSESRQSRSNSKADWFVWADAKADGSPPNNWQSVFGGSSWQWDARRKQYYLHNFLASQPDLNFHNPEVRAALLAIIEFWLKRGVDGFRFDACNFHFHDAQLRDNPSVGLSEAQKLSRNNPYDYQAHRFDKSQPENLAFFQDVRRLLNQYGAASLGEIGCDQSLERMAEYTAGNDKLNMAYSFVLLWDEKSASFIRAQVEEMEAKLQQFAEGGAGWACWTLGNHDRPRVMSRWGKDEQGPAYAKLLLAMSASLRGSLCIYQGEELGLGEADIPFELLQDPVGITFWPEDKGRDGCRTPMPWQHDAEHAGFSQGQPWLPVPAAHTALAVSRQEDEPQSTLNFYRHFLAWRREQALLQDGDICFLEASEPLLVFERSAAEGKLLCVFNLGAEPISFALPPTFSAASLVSGSGLQGASLQAGQLALAGFAGAYLR